MPRAAPHRLQAAALLVPLVGLFLLLPPFITLFGGPVRLFGVPLIVVYLFGVWAALVVAAAWLARRLPLSGRDDVRTGAATLPSDPAPAAWPPADADADPR